MIIGIPRERRPFEFRVGMTPTGVHFLTDMGQTCYIEHDAGVGAGFSDIEYQSAGAHIAYSAHEVFARADMLLKVARPLKEELEWMREGSVLMGLLHLGSTRQDKIDLLLEKKITALSYERIQLPDGSFPVMKPLSEIGGRLVAQVGAQLLQNNEGGKGILLGGIAGVPPAEVVIIGAGVVGSNAAKAFIGMGAHVTVLDINIQALQKIYDENCGVVTMISNEVTIERACAYADIVVGSILVPDSRPPIVITRKMIRNMKPRSIIMDVSIDEGGCVETSRLTTHEKPTYIEEGIIHYCVPNIPSLVARTSTYAYLNSAWPFIREIVQKGIAETIRCNPAIDHGINTYDGMLRHLSRLTISEQGE
ncbi:MAG: alanine dehydrogenase [Chloroflexi bacterium]|nr:MAG: alanine dehydrogenase [Chloroflexota bacterium]